MEFTVPQFIEREPKIVGPLTFKQFVYIGIAGAIVFFLRFFIGKKNLPLFIFLSLIIMGGAVALAFFKIKGYYTLPVFLKNCLAFITTSKFFVWKRKILPPRVKRIEKIEKKEVEEELPLKIREKSQLQKLMTQVETKTR